MPDDKSRNASVKSPLSWTMLLLFSALIIVLWLIVLRLAYSDFQTLRTTEPLAELIALGPSFFLLLVCYVAGFILLTIKYQIGRWQFLVLILPGALFLWYTPYLLAGFVRQADTIWHMGMAANVSQILGGQSMPFSSYVTNYPISYGLGNMLLQVTGSDLIFLSNYMLPIIFLFITILVIYTILNAFVDYRIAGFSLMFTVPLFYYVSLHFSPQVTGILLALTGMLLIRKGKWLLVLLSGGILAFTHIISFGVFATFLALVILIQYRERVMNNRIMPLTTRKIWIFMAAMGALIAITLFTDLLGFISPEFAKFTIWDIGPFLSDNLMNTPWFKILAGIMFFALFCIFAYHIVRRGWKKYKLMKGNISVGIMTSSKVHLLFISMALITLAMGVFIAITGDTPILVERGLMYFIPFSIALVFIYSGKTLAKDDRFRTAFVILLVSMFLIYPIASYPIDAYNSFPVAEESGLEFVGLKMELSNTSMNFYAPGQLDAYIQPGDDILMMQSHQRPYEWYAFRQSGNLKDIMHGNDGDYEYFYHRLDMNRDFNRVYCNPTFYIYHNVEQYR